MAFPRNLELVEDDIAISTEILKRLRLRSSDLKDILANFARRHSARESHSSRLKLLIQKKQTLQDRLNADITRAEYEESLLEGEESQLASLTNQIQEKELSLRQLNAELAITEAEIQRRSPMALDQDGHFEQMNEELAQLEKILKAKRKVLSELQSGETPFADLRQEIDNETVKNLLLLSALDEVREKIAELGDGESLRQVIRAEIESIPGGEVSEGDDDLVQELRLLDRSRRDFEGFRDERLASLREELALTQNDSYLKLLEADKHELERLATL